MRKWNDLEVSSSYIAHICTWRVTRLRKKGNRKQDDDRDETKRRCEFSASFFWSRHIWWLSVSFIFGIIIVHCCRNDTYQGLWIKCYPFCLSFGFHKRIVGVFQIHQRLHELLHFFCLEIFCPSGEVEALSSQNNVGYFYFSLGLLFCNFFWFWEISLKNLLR